MSGAAALFLAIRVFGMLLFATAALGKLRHWAAFVGVVGAYRVVPSMLVPAAAGLVLALELVAAASLAGGIALPAGAVLGGALLLGFAAAMLVAMVRGQREIECGCFSSAMRQRVSMALVLRNLMLASLFAFLVLAPATPPAALAMLDGLAAGLALFLLYVAAGAILSLRGAGAALSERYA